MKKRCTFVFNLLILLYISDSFFSYANIIAIDEKFILDVDKELDFLHKDQFALLLVDRFYNRPKKCPLKSLGKKNLEIGLKKIISSLKYGECYNRNKEIIDGLSDIIENSNDSIQEASEMQGQRSYNSRQIFHKKNVNTNRNIAYPQGAQNYLQINSYYQDMLGSLSHLAQDEECTGNIRKRGILPVMADVATTMGQAAAMMPTPNGFLITAGGLALGSTFRVIHGLLKSPYKWNDSSQRKQFQQLNCKFFDLRRDMENAEILSPPDETLSIKISEIKKAQIIIKAKIAEYEKKVEFLKKNIDELERKYIKKTMGDSFYFSKEISEHLIEAIEIIKKSEEKATIKNNLIMQTIKSSEELKQDFAIVAADLPFKEHFFYLINELSWKNIKKHNEMADADFERKIYNPFFGYLQKYHGALSKIESKHKQDFLNYKSAKYKLSNIQVIEKIDQAFMKIFSELELAVSRLEQKKIVLEIRNQNKMFDSNDDGTLVSYNIIEEYIEIQNLIFNKLGYSYLKYFRDLSYEEIKNFYKLYKNFQSTYEDNISEIDKPWACRDAKQIAIHWSNANFASEIAYDFIETNRGICHSNVKKIRTFFYFFPVGRTKQYQLYKQARAAEMAKGILLKKNGYNRKRINKIERRKSKNIGEIMLKLKESEKKRLLIETYLDKNMCSKFF
jgi:hypothetical protein